MISDRRPLIELTTYQWCEPTALNDEDIAYLRGESPQQINIVREVDSQAYRLNPNQYVGVLRLPSGVRIECRPRVGVANILYMLAVAYRMPSSFRHQLATFAPFDQVIDAVASYFADTVNELVSRGLYRSYMERDENLPIVRGRIMFAEDARLNFALRHRTYCRYSELTWDIPENQVLRQVAQALSNWPFRRREIPTRLALIAGELSELSPSSLRVEDIDRFTYHRQNEYYRRSHALCRLFLETVSLSEHAGDVRFQTFLLDMNKLFESFVSQALEDRLEPSFRVGAQIPTSLDTRGAVRIQPDLLLSRGTEDLLVGDCKFKRLGEDEFKNHDHYQLLAYCTALGIDRGVLIYPLHEVAATQEVDVRNSSIHLATLTVDIGGDVDYLEAECDRLAGAMAAEALRT
jgi:5-methylcytosine-specific restriction enzyme subunit McrC